MDTMRIVLGISMPFFKSKVILRKSTKTKRVMTDQLIENRRNLIKLILILALVNFALTNSSAQVPTIIGPGVAEINKEFRPSQMNLIQTPYSFTLSFKISGSIGDSGEYFVRLEGHLIRQGTAIVGQTISVTVETNKGRLICGTESKYVECGARLYSQNKIYTDGCIVVIGTPCGPLLPVPNFGLH